MGLLRRREEEGRSPPLGRRIDAGLRAVVFFFRAVDFLAVVFLAAAVFAAGFRWSPLAWVFSEVENALPNSPPKVAARTFSVVVLGLPCRRDPGSSCGHRSEPTQSARPPAP